MPFFFFVSGKVFPVSSTIILCAKMLLSNVQTRSVVFSFFFFETVSTALSTNVYQHEILFSSPLLSSRTDLVSNHFLTVWKKRANRTYYISYTHIILIVSK